MAIIPAAFFKACLYLIKAKLLWFVLLSSLSSVSESQDSSLTWMTEEYPPYNFHNSDGELVGISVELLLAIMNEMNSPLKKEEIVVIPWARAYRETLQSPKTAIFTMTKSQLRERLFLFSSAIMPSKISVITLKNTQKLKRVSDLNSLNVGVVRNDIGEQLLNKHGLNTEVTVKLPTSLELIRMLLLNRIDVIAIDETIAAFEFARLGVSSDNYVIHFTIEELTTHYAFNKSVNEDFILAFSNTFNKLKADGSFEAILKKYKVSSIQ